MKNTLLMLGAALCMQALQAQAADLKDIPSQTHWVLSLDLKAAQAAPLVNTLVSQMDAAKKTEAENKLAAVKALFGVDLLKDIDHLIIAGNGNAEKGGVAYVYGTFDAQRLTTIIAGSKNFASTECSGFTMLSWLDEKDNKAKCLSFAKPGLALISSSTAALTEALDVLAGKKAGLSPDSPLCSAFTRTPQNLFSLHAFDVSAIVGQAPKAELLKQAQTLSFEVQSLNADTLQAVLSVTAATDETALQLHQAAMGVQALMLLQADNKPELSTLASLAQISNKGRTVGITLKLPKSVIEKAMSDRQARLNAAAAAPAAAPAAVN
jgi:hypothetical protein